VLYRVALALVRVPISIGFRPTVRGRENVPRDGGFVIAANHLSGFDSFALAVALAPRRLHFMAKNQLFARRFLGPLIRGLGGFPARGNGASTGVAAGARLARKGRGVVIFPTGARHRRDRGHRARGGAAHTALSGNVPLVPAAISGTDGWRRLQRWHVAVGPAVPLDDLDGPQAVADATRRLWTAIEDLCRELPQEVAA
jgi:1-acyl-sn-glycerol-3-phosphate acyltransferase